MKNYNVKLRLIKKVDNDLFKKYDSFLIQGVHYDLDLNIFLSLPLQEIKKYIIS